VNAGVRRPRCVDSLKLNTRELENVVHEDIRIQLVRLRQADLLAAAEVSRLAAAPGRPKNRPWLRLAHVAQRTVFPRRVRPERPAHVT
jgi:hypothetical protein